MPTSQDFYHAHHAGQALDGLVGPFIVHSPDDRANQQIPYATDRVVMLQDWYHDLSSGLLRQKLSPGSEASPDPNGALINGANVLDCALHPHRRCDNSSARRPVFDLAAGASHRLRFVNFGGYAWFEVSVDGHGRLPVTEVDGVDVEPAPEATLVIGPGQRYSVVLTANQTHAGAGAFWLRARMLTHCFAESVLPDGGVAEAKAVIRYVSAGDAHAQREGAEPVPLPTTENDSGVFTTSCKDMTAAGQPYRPVPPRPAPEAAHRSYHLRINMEIGSWRLERGFLNRSSFRPDLRSPSLHRAVDGLAAGNASFLGPDGVNDRAFDASRELVISHGGIEVVDVILQNLDEGNHPFHLHGRQMFVLATGHGYFPGYAALGLAAEGKGLLHRADGQTPNSTAAVLGNPVRRDVATVEGFGWSLVRFVADNPGLWMFHCHILWHGESGMAMQFLSRADVLKDWAIPKENRELCAASADELEKGAAPEDSVFYGHGGRQR